MRRRPVTMTSRPSTSEDALKAAYVAEHDQSGDACAARNLNDPRPEMKKTNDSYCVVFQGKRTTERYYRDSTGWLKVSSRGRTFRATAEQVLNHLLPALAFGDKLGLTVTVEHYDGAYWKQLADDAEKPSGSPLQANADSR